MSEVIIRTTLLDEITVNGRISKKRYYKVIEPYIAQLEQKLAKSEEALKVYEEAVELVTDQKSKLFPNGEMLEMYGSKSGETYCKYNRETIVKVRQAQQKIKEILGREGSEAKI